LSQFQQAYQQALQADTVSRRYALMAVAEAELLASGVMLPLTAGGGSYTISRVAPYTGPYALWGNDADRLHSLLLTTEPIEAEDVAEMKAQWAKLRGTGEYEAWAREYLQQEGYSLRDSYRIYKVILGNFVKFMGASIVSFLIDNGVFTLLDQFVFPGAFAGRVALSTIIARCVSAPCNFLLNRNLVFNFKKDTGKTALRYALLCVLILALSSGALTVLSVLGMPKWLDTIAKIIIDSVLYLVSYRVQNKWVFAPAKESK
jgi:putative flippase GtrA